MPVGFVNEIEWGGGSRDGVQLEAVGGTNLVQTLSKHKIKSSLTFFAQPIPCDKSARKGRRKRLQNFGYPARMKDFF
jgi:hypothetical protein